MALFGFNKVKQVEKILTTTEYHNSGTVKEICKTQGGEYFKRVRPGIGTNLRSMGVTEVVTSYGADPTCKKIEKILVPRGVVTEKPYEFTGENAIKEYREMIKKGWDARKAGFVVTI